VADFSSDLTEDKSRARTQIQLSATPNLEVSDTDFALPVQRTSIPKDFRGLISGVWIQGSEFLKPYLDPLKTLISGHSVRLDALEEAVLSLDPAEDIEAPKLILLDLIDNINSSGNYTVEFRVYIDD
jgi:hypothetical protein